MNIGLSIKQQRILAIAVVVLACAWFFWFRHYLDKQKFERIEVTLNELVTRIETELDVKVVDSSKYCRRQSRKFAEGPLNCYIARKFLSPTIISEKFLDLALENNNLTTDSAGRLRFRLHTEDAICSFSDNASTSDKIIDNYVTIECSKRATASHFQFIE